MPELTPVAIDHRSVQLPTEFSGGAAYNFPTLRASGNSHFAVAAAFSSIKRTKDLSQPCRHHGR